MTIRYDALIQSLAARDAICVLLAMFAAGFVIAWYLLRRNPRLHTGFIALSISFWITLLVRYYALAFGG